MMSAYRVFLKLEPAEPTAVWDYLVIARGSQAALAKVFKQMNKDTKGYAGSNTIVVQSLTRVDATLVR